MQKLSPLPGGQCKSFCTYLARRVDATTLGFCLKIELCSVKIGDLG